MHYNPMSKRTTCHQLTSLLQNLVYNSKGLAARKQLIFSIKGKFTTAKHCRRIYKRVTPRSTTGSRVSFVLTCVGSLSIFD